MEQCIAIFLLNNMYRRVMAIFLQYYICLIIFVELNYKLHYTFWHAVALPRNVLITISISIIIIIISFVAWPLIIIKLTKTIGAL